MACAKRPCGLSIPLTQHAESATVLGPVLGVCGEERRHPADPHIEHHVSRVGEQSHAHEHPVLRGEGGQVDGPLHGAHGRPGGVGAKHHGSHPVSHGRRLPLTAHHTTRAHTLHDVCEEPSSSDRSDDGSEGSEAWCDTDSSSSRSSAVDDHAVHAAHVPPDASNLSRVRKVQVRGGDEGLERRLKSVAERMIRGNRCGNLPSSDLLDIDTSDFPLHVKGVAPLSLQALSDLPCCAPDVDDRWKRVHGWLTGDHPTDVSRGRGTEARITRQELDLLLELRHIERTTREAVRSTCDVFPVPESPPTQRRRLIKHTKWLCAPRPR
eukprot:PhM_4_TR3007/c0_g3_i1/m.37687